MHIKYKCKNLDQFFFKNFVYKPICWFVRKKIWKSYELLLLNSRCTLEELHEKQLHLLREQVVYCYNNISFYRSRFDSAGFDVNSKFSFEYFCRNTPLLEKKDIRDNIDSNLSSCDKRRLTKRQTSGSTGNPLVLYKDDEAMSFIDAAMHRNFSWYDIDVGDRRAHYWGFGAGFKGRFKFILRDYLTNWRRFNCFELSETNIRKYHKCLERFRPKYVYGYAKCIFEFTISSQKLGLSVKHPLSVVVVTGEKIYGKQKKIISEYFNAPVAEEYGCTECGIIAFECPQGGMHLMSDMLLVETVKDSPFLATKGIGGSIVVSELRGRFFPLIRYRIGDIGVLSERQCSCRLPFPLIEEIQGREDDYIHHPDGTKIDAYCIEYSIQNVSKKLGIVNKVKGKQLPNFDIVIFVVGVFPDKESWQDVFLREIDHYLKGLPVKVVFVDDLPREESGKLKFFHSEFTSQQFPDKA